MKKRILALAMVTLLIISSCLAVHAEESGKNVVDKTTDILGATYTDYTITGQSSGVTADAHTIEFNPADGLVPLAYAANAGIVTLADGHIEDAEGNGYTVVGGINGSFFEMTTGNPCGTLISDGKLVFTHATLKESLAVFGYDGSLDIINSSIQFKMNLAGKNLAGSIGLVNKKYSACSLTSSDIKGRFHYYDVDACNLADESVKGYELICEKLDGTELSVGKTLSGKVLEVKADSYYGATEITEENKFVLFVTADSARFATTAAGIKVGDSVSITASESDSLVADKTNNAQSAISSAYWLVKDGKDITDTTSTIIHSTTLARAWTAFGIKEDGTYVYWASEEYGLTLQDVADAMIEMGCVDVIRLDGGGSTSIYAKEQGSPITTTRAVCDMLLIVKKDELKSKDPASQPEAPETPEPPETPETSDDSTPSDDPTPPDEPSDVAPFMGEEVADAAFKMDISASNVYVPGKEFTVTVTVNGINAPNGLHSVIAVLHYDNDKVDLLGDDSEDFIDCFQGYADWENFSMPNTDDDDNQIVELCAGAVSGNMTALKEDGKVVFKLKFRANSDASGDIKVWIPHGEMLGDYITGDSSDEFTGNGSYVIIPQGTEADLEEMPQDTDTTNDDDGGGISLTVIIIIAAAVVIAIIVIIIILKKKK